MNHQELDLAISSLVKSYVKAKRELESVDHENKKDILEDEIQVLSSLLLRLERAKNDQLPAGG